MLITFPPVEMELCQIKCLIKITTIEHQSDSVVIHRIKFNYGKQIKNFI